MSMTPLAKKRRCNRCSLLSVIDKSPHPIQHIYKLWVSRDEDVHKHRALKDICKQAKHGFNRWKNRSIQNIVGKIRTICTAVELCLLEGEHLEHIIHVIELYKTKKELTPDGLGKHMAQEFAKSGVTKPREKPDAHNIFTSPQYSNAKFPWKSFL